MTDLFDTPEKIPPEVRACLDSFEDNTYDELQRVLDLITPLGYTYEYYLDAEPHNFKPITNN